jgi:Thermostable hemolysin
MRALSLDPPRLVSHIVPADSPIRASTESFIRDVFALRHNAHVPSFTPHLMLLEQDSRPVAAAGWRGAADGSLFLERYLNEPVEAHIARLAGHAIRRAEVVEVGHLAAMKSGAGAQMILTMASHLDSIGYRWVVFTATRELLGIFNKLALPPLALAMADPARLGDEARHWGNYYDTRPVIVAGRIRLALERTDRGGGLA